MDESIKAINAPTQCLNNRASWDMCYGVAAKAKDAVPGSGYQYEYERLIYDASCVDYERDSDAKMSRKVNLMWNK